MSVPQFYKGKGVLITGGTGFVGKALVEKLLRSCPDVGVVYLLLRAKKGVHCEERLTELCGNRVFDLLREQNPDGFKKLKPINGDVTQDGLGLSQEDTEELQKNCNIIFHGAACVRFDQKLKDAVNMNVTGTYRVLSLAETMVKLEAFIHLSTTYCRCDLEVLEEKVYPAVHKPMKIMDIVEWMDDATLQHLEPKIIESEPNTYSYTKAITEDLLDEYSGKFPVAIARPSIVTAAWKEPAAGWIDGKNGPTGLIIASGKGVLRTMLCEPSATPNIIPVDVVVNACILIGYVTSLDKNKTTTVYNVSLPEAIKIKWCEIIKLGEKFVNENPYTEALWYPGGSIKTSRMWHCFDAFLFHTIPAYFVDALLFLAGQKRFMVKIQKRISQGLEVVQYFTTKEWYFNNNNYMDLHSRVNEKDNEVFYTDLSVANCHNEYLKNYVLGIREFVCNEDPANLPRARKLHMIRYVCDRIVKIIFFALLLWFLYCNIYVFTSSVTYLDDTLKSLAPRNQLRASDGNIV